MSDSESDYFERVERQFGLRRAGRLMLSPRDWQLVQEWHDRGLPPEVVLLGINRAFDRFEPTSSPQQINSLRYCKQHVEEVWQEHREAAGSASSRGAMAALAMAAEHLRSASDTCLAAATSCTGDGADALRSAADALQDLAGRADSGTVDVGEIDSEARTIEQGLATQMEGSRGGVRLPPFSPWA